VRFHAVLKNVTYYKQSIYFWAIPKTLEIGRSQELKCLMKCLTVYAEEEFSKQFFKL